VNPHIKALWVKALRSGEYRQTKGQLIQAANPMLTYPNAVATGSPARQLAVNGGEAAYCCLGVLCDLYEQETGKTLGRAWDMTVLPASVVHWAELPDNNPDINYVGTIETFKKIPMLSDVNDYTSIGFAGIADIIDDQL
jgi:hypothetical protein